MNCGFTYEIRDNTNPDLVYYGSSELPTLEDRMKIHIQHFNAWKNNNDNKYCYSFKVLELNNYTPTLLKIVFFTIKWELKEHERKLIESNECCNHNIPNRTRVEHYQADKEHFKEKNKQYYEANKEHRKEQFAEWYQENKKQYNERRKEEKKKYYQENKEKLNEKITCPCGCVINKRSKARHKKSQKHLNWVQLKDKK
tara:strand:+ start:67 stop:660 length:594 start_codon:yes stop_codon:yes gene_type:complete